MGRNLYERFNIALILQAVHSECMVSPEKQSLILNYQAAFSKGIQRQGTWLNWNKINLHNEDFNLSFQTSLFMNYSAQLKKIVLGSRGRLFMYSVYSFFIKLVFYQFYNPVSQKCNPCNLGSAFINSPYHLMNNTFKDSREQNSKAVSTPRTLQPFQSECRVYRWVFSKKKLLYANQIHPAKLTKFQFQVNDWHDSAPMATQHLHVKAVNLPNVIMAKFQKQVFYHSHKIKCI